MTEDVMAGTSDDGVDLDPADPVALFLDDLRRRQESVWAIVQLGSVRIDGKVWDTSYGSAELYLKSAESCTVYFPQLIDGFNVRDWLDENYSEVRSARDHSVKSSVGDAR